MSAPTGNVNAIIDFYNFTIVIDLDIEREYVQVHYANYWIYHIYSRHMCEIQEARINTQLICS